MVDSISLYYFSGTGNTEKIALSFYRILRKSVSVCSVFRMEDHLHGNSRPVLQNSVVGILFPVHFHTMPRIVHEFIKNASFAPYTRVFLILVSSDNGYMNRTALLSATHMIEKKQARVFLHYILPMPKNIIRKHPAYVSKKLDEIAQIKIRSLSARILQLKENKMSFSIIHKISFFLSYYTNFISKKFGRRLTVSQKCTSCGLCIRNCPARNISMDLGIKFHNNCTLCLRCIYYCPEHAIIPSWFKSLPITGGYDLESQLNSSFAKLNNSELEKILPKNLITYIEKSSAKK